MKTILDDLTEQQRREHYIKKNYIELYLDIMKFKEKYFKEINYTQLLYNYKKNITKTQKCKICNNAVKFNSFMNGYNKYCSKKCVMSDSNIIKKRNNKSKLTKLRKYNDKNYNNMEKTKSTNIKKYGVEYFTQTKEFKEKTKQTNLEKYHTEYFTQTEKFREKLKQTNIEKYGVEYFTQTKEFKEKTEQTKLKKYGNKNFNNIEKIKQTNIKKYGVEHHMIYKKKHNLLKEITLNASLTYYKNLLSSNYTLLNITGDDIKLHHITCNSDFSIKKQLFYLRQKHNHKICTLCNPLIKIISYKENQLYDFIKKYYDSEIIISNRNILDGKELDIYLPDLKLAFEFNGLYWHNELYKDNKYHLNKSEKCLEKNIQLIHIWEDDWIYKNDIVKSMILNKLGKTKNKIYARKTEIKEINDNKLIRDFLNKNHLQGFIGSKVKLGLFYDNELVSLMTFGKKRLFMKSKSVNKNEYELLRYCNKINTNVVGGASKLFKYFIRNYNPLEIITYADRSHSQGNLYEKLGFNFIHKTQPNYYYIKNKNRYHRFNFRKDKLVKEGYDGNMTEHEIMLSRNIYRIYDSGSLKYIWKIEKTNY